VFWLSLVCLYCQIQYAYHWKFIAYLTEKNCILVTKTSKWMMFREIFYCENGITYKSTVCVCVCACARVRACVRACVRAKCRDFQWMYNFHKMRSYHIYMLLLLSVCVSFCLLLCVLRVYVLPFYNSRSHLKLLWSLLWNDLRGGVWVILVARYFHMIYMYNLKGQHISNSLLHK